MCEDPVTAIPSCSFFFFSLARCFGVFFCFGLVALFFHQK